MKKNFGLKSLGSRSQAKIVQYTADTTIFATDASLVVEILETIKVFKAGSCSKVN